jgi:hypothetical protein
MDALDQLVTQVQALSGSEQDVAHLSTVLKQADELLHTHALRLGYALAALSFDAANAGSHRPRTFSRIPFAFSHPRRSRRLARGFRQHVDLVLLPELARVRCCPRSQILRQIQSREAEALPRVSPTEVCRVQPHRRKLAAVHSACKTSCIISSSSCAIRSSCPRRTSPRSFILRCSTCRLNL